MRDYEVKKHLKHVFSFVYVQSLNVKKIAKFLRDRRKSCIEIKISSYIRNYSYYMTEPEIFPKAS